MNKDTSVIPKDTPYCYTPTKFLENGGYEIDLCPYWASYFDEETSEDIYVCHFIDEFDRKYETSLIWDMCKICGISEGLEDESL